MVEPTFIPEDNYGCQCGSILKGMALARHRATCSEYKKWFELNKVRLVEEFLTALKEGKLHNMLDKYNMGASTLYRAARDLGKNITLPMSYCTGYVSPGRKKELRRIKREHKEARQMSQGARYLTGQPDAIAELKAAKMAIDAASDVIEVVINENTALRAQAQEDAKKWRNLKQYVQ